MATSDRATVRIRGGFPPGTKVGLARRHGDFFNPRNARAEKTATVTDDSTVEFAGLPDGQRYWVFSLEEEDRRALAATAKVPQPGKQRLTPREISERLSQTRPPRTETTRTTTRVIAASGLPFQGEHVGKPTPDEHKELEAQPRLRQEDARNVPQRSATVTGSAHPVDPGEPQPKPSQSDIPKNTPQRSATPFGEATPIPADDASPGLKQEDVRDRPQRSATETGVAVLKPLGDHIEQAKARDASVTQAVGEEDPAPKQSESASHRRQSTKRQVKKTVQRDVTSKNKK